jgi:phosphoglycerate dehydrogenase-like enzyme
MDLDAAATGVHAIDAIGRGARARSDDDDDGPRLSKLYPKLLTNPAVISRRLRVRMTCASVVSRHIFSRIVSASRVAAPLATRAHRQPAQVVRHFATARSSPSIEKFFEGFFHRRPTHHGLTTRAMSTTSSVVPHPPDGVTTTLLVVTKPELVASAPLNRITSGTDTNFPADRFDVKVATTLDDFPKETLDAAHGNPVALLWWFGDANVIGGVLRSRCAERVRWIHSGSAGVEHILNSQKEVVNHPSPMTNAKGAFSDSLGEWAIFASMWFSKKVHAMRKSQAAGEWMRDTVGMLKGKTMSIVGYGDIGKACAIRAKAMGMRVVALRRDPRKSEGDVFVDEMLPLTELRRAMEQGDFIVLALPHTPSTEKMIDSAAIGAMKPSGVLINVGRGAVVDEDALVDALTEGRIGGAGLDVTAVEPLPTGHPFYSLENVLMSFHCADLTDDYHELTMDTFVEHARVYTGDDDGVEGGRWNLVDKSAGY